MRKSFVMILFLVIAFVGLSSFEKVSEIEVGLLPPYIESSEKVVCVFCVNVDEFRVDKEVYYMYRSTPLLEFSYSNLDLVYFIADFNLAVNTLKVDRIQKFEFG